MLNYNRRVKCQHRVYRKGCRSINVTILGPEALMAGRGKGRRHLCGGEYGVNRLPEKKNKTNSEF